MRASARGRRARQRARARDAFLDVVEEHTATGDGLMDALGEMDLSDFGATCSVAERVNQLRVEQAARARGATAEDNAARCSGWPARPRRSSPAATCASTAA
jgi:hypothetical protein